MIAPLHWPRALCLALALAAVAKCLIAPEKHTVYPRFVAGALDWWAGWPLFAPDAERGMFRYSPAFAVAMTPLALLDLRTGGALWALLNLGCYWLGLRRFAQGVLGHVRGGPAEAAFLLLALPGATRSLWNGQSHPLVSGLMLLAAAALADERRWRAAAGFAAAGAAKLAPLFVGAVLIVCRPALLVPALCCTALVAALPFAFQSPAYVWEQYAAWFDHLGRTAAQRWPSFRDAWTVWATLAGSVPVVGYRIAQALTGLLVVLACRRVAQRTARRDAPPLRDALPPVLGLSLGWLMLFGPAVEFQTFVWLTPLAAWAALDACQRRRGRRFAVTAYVLTTFLGYGAIERALTPLTPLAPLLLPAGVVLLLVWIIAYAPPQEECHTA